MGSHGGIKYLLLTILGLTISAEFKEYRLVQPDESTNAIWQLTIFVEQVMREWEGNIDPFLDPLSGPTQNINMTFPSYLLLKGDIYNMRYEGFKNFKVKTVSVDTNMINIVLQIDSSLIATHNLNGTVELNSGEIVVIGGDKERTLNLTSRPSLYTYRTFYNVEDGYITIPDFPSQTLYLQLRPRTEDGRWSIDFGGKNWRH
jgi:hypothetical protein